MKTTGYAPKPSMAAASRAVDPAPRTAAPRNGLTTMNSLHYARGVLQRREAGSVAPAAVPAGAPRRADGGNLPARLKSGAEALSGISLDQVRVHYNSSEPARMSALAYARGNHIYLGPGQERHLPHETWHVVQQRQHRVKPTTQFKGAAFGGAGLNDDARLEREADRMGELAARGPTPAAGTALPAAKSAIGDDVVQAKMGFEFQTSNPITREDGQQLGFKRVAYRGRRFQVEPDSTDMEFITDPYDTWDHMNDAMKEMFNFINNLKRQAVRGQFHFRRNVDGWREDGKLDIQDAEFSAAMQATEGVPLDRIGPYLEEHLDLRDEGAGVNRRTAPWLNLFGARGQGLLRMIVLYLQRADHVPNAVEDDDGPKALFRTMARTDFHTMYESLPDEQKGAFQRLVIDLYNGANGARDSFNGLIGRNWNDPVFPQGFYYDGHNAHRAKENGPTIYSWLHSIVYGGGPHGWAKDLMSPPIATHAENLEGIASYGMGREGIDHARDGTPLPLFEMRGLQSKYGNIPYPEWITYARRLFFSAAARNSSLTVPRPQPRYVRRRSPDRGNGYHLYAPYTPPDRGRAPPDRRNARSRSRSPEPAPRGRGRRRSRSRSRSRSPYRR